MLDFEREEAHEEELKGEPVDKAVVNTTSPSGPPAQAEDTQPMEPIEGLDRAIGTISSSPEMPVLADNNVQPTDLSEATVQYREESPSPSPKVPSASPEPTAPMYARNLSVRLRLLMCDACYEVDD